MLEAENGIGHVATFGARFTGLSPRCLGVAVGGHPVQELFCLGRPLTWWERFTIAPTTRRSTTILIVGHVVAGGVLAPARRRAAGWVQAASGCRSR
jgi:hypothetical protein